MKDENESFEVVIRRLIERRKERIRNGSGYWDEEDAETAREQIDEMRDGFN